MDLFAKLLDTIGEHNIISSAKQMQNCIRDVGAVEEGRWSLTMSEILLHCTGCEIDDGFSLHVYNENEIWVECSDCGNATKWSTK